MTKERELEIQIEGVTKDLIEITMEERNLPLEEAMSIIYRSNTYRKLERSETGLYYQGAVYIYDMLCEELRDNHAHSQPSGQEFTGSSAISTT